MIFLLTNAGRVLFEATPGSPPVLNQYRIGSQYNYAASASQNDLEGSVLYSGSPSNPIIHPDNVVQYTILLPPSAGDFFFGEVGLFHAGELVAIGVSNVPIHKISSSGAQVGNYVNISAYVTFVEGSPDIFVEVGNSQDNLSVEVAYSIDSLPPAAMADPNVRIVPHYGSTESSLAVSNGGKWSISGYELVSGTTIATATSANSVSVSTTSEIPNLLGDVLVQCVNGPASGLVRRATFDADTSTFTLINPWSVLPTPGTSVEVMRREMFPTSINELLRGLDPQLTAEDLNSLLAHPLEGMVKRDGSLALTGPLNFSGFRARNVGDPMTPSDAVNLGFLTDVINDLSIPDPGGPLVVDGGTF